MRNITDRQIRNALRMLYAGTDREKIAAAVNLRLDIIDQIAVGDITPINAQIPRRKIPPRRCPGCGATINRWPCILCEPDVPVPGDVLVEVEGSDGLTSSQEERKAQVQQWREKFGDPSNPQHPLYRDSRVHGSNDGEKADGEEKGAKSAKRRKRQV